MIRYGVWNMMQFCLIFSSVAENDVLELFSFLHDFDDYRIFFHDAAHNPIYFFFSPKWFSKRLMNLITLSRDELSRKIKKRKGRLE